MSSHHTRAFIYYVCKYIILPITLWGGRAGPPGPNGWAKPDPTVLRLHLRWAPPPPIGPGKGRLRTGLWGWLQDANNTLLHLGVVGGIRPARHYFSYLFFVSLHPSRLPNCHLLMTPSWSTYLKGHPSSPPKHFLSPFPIYWFLNFTSDLPYLLLIYAHNNSSSSLAIEAPMSVGTVDCATHCCKPSTCSTLGT